MKIFGIILLGLALSGCVTAGNKSYEPLTPREKLTSYPDYKESERAERIYYDMLSKRPITKEDEEFWKENAAKTIAGQYEIAHMLFLGKQYKISKQLLMLPADKGFGPAQYECGISNAFAKGPVEETYAYIYLASKSNLKEAYIPARAALEKLDKIVSKKSKTRGIELAENIQAAYLPEFKHEVDMTEFSYFGVLLKNSLEYMEEDIAAKDKKSYAEDKRNLD